MTSQPAPLLIEETPDLVIHLDVARRGDDFEVLRMSIDTDHEPSMADVAAIFKHVANEIRRGNCESLGMRQ